VSAHGRSCAERGVKMRRMRRTRSAIAVAAVVILITLGAVGCAPKVLPRRDVTPPPIAYCHDGVGHIPGSEPWVLGGRCCCTPTEQMFATYQEEDTVPDTMTYNEFLKMFSDRGIITDLDVEFRGSNCRCDYGPHVVFGGKCMITPTPGTLAYEEVTAGKRLQQD
jgi:hypothetical protein